MVLETAIKSTAFLILFFLCSYVAAHYLGKVMNKIDTWRGKND